VLQYFVFISSCNSTSMAGGAQVQQMYVAVRCCSVLQRVASGCSVLCSFHLAIRHPRRVALRYNKCVLQCAAACCSVLQRVVFIFLFFSVCCSVYRHLGAALRYNKCVLQCVAVCCSVLQCAAACCSVLQRVAVYCSVLCSFCVFQCLLQCLSAFWRGTQ